MPALLLNYFGQGALLLREPARRRAIRSSPWCPPGALTYVLVGARDAGDGDRVAGADLGRLLADAARRCSSATSRASTIEHTSSDTEGQIYIAAINWLLAVACLALVLAFRESTRLAAAYGIAVTGTMAITSVVYFVVARDDWGWPLWKALPLLLLFLSSTCRSSARTCSSSSTAATCRSSSPSSSSSSWSSGGAAARILLDASAQSSPTPRTFSPRRCATASARVPGTGVFLTAHESGMPATLAHFRRHVNALPQRIAVLRVRFEHVPRVRTADSVEVAEEAPGFLRITLRAGFMERPCLPERLRDAKASCKLALDAPDVTYYIGRETFLRTNAGDMGRVAETLYAFLYNVSSSATGYFGLPPEQVMEVGMHIDL